MATTVNIYLTFEGNCEAAFNYYRTVFGGEFAMINRFAEMPENPAYPIPEAAKNKIMHVTLPIGGDTVLMGSDALPSFGKEVKVGNNFSISVTPESEEDANRIFEALTKDGTITMPLDKTFWGALFGSCVDAYGINWMVNYTYPQKGS